MTEEIEIKLKRIRNVMNNFEDALCEDMQNEVDQIKEYIEKQQKEIEKKDICLKACEDNLIKERQLRIKQDKVINLMAKSWKQDDVRSVEEIKEYFYKLVEVEDEKR